MSRKNWSFNTTAAIGVADIKNVRVVEGDLLESKEQYLCHQCNCVTVKGAHLSASVFARFPHANIYLDRLKSNKRDLPGTILIRPPAGSIDEKRKIINMLAQYYPGKSRFMNDTGALRRKWFQSCLDQIAAIPNLESLAFPKGIGCGAAGGDWTLYLEMIHQFAKNHPQVHITIYQLPTPSPSTSISHIISAPTTSK